MDVIIHYDEMKRNGVTIEYTVVKSYGGIIPPAIDSSYYRMSYIEREEYLIAMGGEPVKPIFGYKIIIDKCPVNKVYFANPNGWAETIFGIPMVEGGYHIKHEYRYKKLIEAIPAVYW